MHSGVFGDGPAASLTRFTDLALTDYLDDDPRATFAFHLKSHPFNSTAGLNIVFTNKAFRRVAHCCNNGHPETSVSYLRQPVDIGTTAFVAWATGSLRDEYFEYHDFVWKAVTIRQEWRVISGTCTGESISRTLSRSYRSPEPQQDRDQGHRASISSVTSEPRSYAREMFDFISSSSSASSNHCRYIRDFDWAATPVGPIDTWPRSLVQAMPFLLCNPEPCCIYWGPARTMIFNEQFTKLLRGLSDQAMGASAKILFAFFWDPFEKLCLEIEKSASAVKHDAVRVLLDRSQGVEESFFNYTLMPLLEVSGQVRGIFNLGVEVTKQLVAQRELNTLIKVGNETTSTTSLNDFWRCMFNALEVGVNETPFAAVYSYDADTLLNDSTQTKPDRLKLQASFGIPDDHPARLDTIDLSQREGFAPALKLVSESAQPLLVSKDQSILLEEVYERYSEHGVGTSFSQLLVIPLTLSPDAITAYLVLGLNPLRHYNEDYSRFMNIFSRQIEGALTSVVLFQKEQRRLLRSMEQAESQRRWLAQQLDERTKEVKQSDLRFYNFAKQAPIGVYILGKNGEIKYCNDAWYSLVGIPFGYEGPVPWRTHVHPDDLAEVDRQWERLNDGHTQTDFEWRAIKDPSNHSPGNIKHLRSSCFPELDEDGALKTVTGILVDVSVHRAHEQEATERMTSALEAKRAQENFMDMVSHEMRNPLNAMLQCAAEASQLISTLSSSSSAGSQELAMASNVLEAVETIQYCGRHQKQIIDDVLTISKLDSDLLTLSPMETTPGSIMDQVVRIFSSEIRAADITVTRETKPEDGHTTCLLDFNRVLQILINLVGNAIKFLKDRPTRELHLSITTSSTRPPTKNVNFVPSGRKRKQPMPSSYWGVGRPTFVHFSVTDTGPGLSQKEMDTLFARFKQASPRTHAQYGGSGLGLFISRELSELHGGEIGLASEVNKGSTFAFYVEGRTSVPKAQQLPTRPSFRAMGRTNSSFLRRKSATGNLTPEETKILIVEDNLVNQKVLQRQLRRLGYTTFAANDGQEALDLISTSHWHIQTTDESAPDISVVLCDLEMPVMDGMTFIREVRQQQRDGTLSDSIPVIAITGNARNEQVSAAKEAGFDDVVCKPYLVSDLVPLISKLVNTANQQHPTT